MEIFQNLEFLNLLLPLVWFWYYFCLISLVIHFFDKYLISYLFEDIFTNTECILIFNKYNKIKIYIKTSISVIIRAFIMNFLK